MAGAIDTWEKHQQRIINQYLKGWDWNQVYGVWCDQFCRLSVSLDPLFSEIWVYDPDYPKGRERFLSWCPVDNIYDFQLKLQRHFDKYPGTHGPTNPYNFLDGEMQTLEYLWSYKDNMEKIAAILISGSLFSRLRSSRRHFPGDNWPPYICVDQIAKWANEEWNRERHFYSWQHYHTDVLPYTNFDYELNIQNIETLVRYLADEHAKVFENYKPVNIEFKNNREPFTEKKLKDEYEFERKRHLEFERNMAKMAQSNKVKRRWETISKEELEKLVWSKPTTMLVKELGVSDVAIGKKCKALGIQKPKSGFWAKVNAGKIPHPQGKPIDSD